MAADVNQAALFFDDVRAAFVNESDQFRDGAFIAGNDAGRKYHGVALFNRDAFVNLRRHLVERGARLSLRSGDEEHDFVIGHQLCVVDADQHAVMDIEITKPIGNLYILLHGSTEHANLPIELLRHVQHNLQPMDGGREGRHNDTTAGFRKNLFEGGNNRAFRRRTSRHRRIRRIRQQRQHAFLTVTAQGPEIDWLANHRRLINLVITCVNNRADRCFDRQMKTVDQ